MKLLRLPIMLVACAAFAAPAFAQGKGGGQGGGMMQPRQDQDMQEMHDQMMGKKQDQMQGRMQDQMQGQMQDRDRLYLGAKDKLRAHDRDGDGKMNREEFDAWRGAAFDAMDTDKNGLSLQEYHALRLGPGPLGGANEARQEEMQERATLRKSERFRVMDGDGDGVVTRAEYMKMGQLNYLDADANDDGVLTFKEMQQFHRGM